MKVFRAGTWYVAFVPAPNRGIYRWLGGFDPTAAHCYAFRPDTESQHWLFAEHSALGLDVRMFSGEHAGDLIELVLHTGHLVLYRGKARRLRMWPGPMTCTETIKALLGINSLLTITPKQLLCELLRRGAERIVCPTPE